MRQNKYIKRFKIFPTEMIEMNDKQFIQYFENKVKNTIEKYNLIDKKV